MLQFLINTTFLYVCQRGVIKIYKKYLTTQVCIKFLKARTTVLVMNSQYPFHLFYPFNPLSPILTLDSFPYASFPFVQFYIMMRIT